MLRDVGPGRRVLVVGAHLPAPGAQQRILCGGILTPPLPFLPLPGARDAVRHRRRAVLAQVSSREVERRRLEVAQRIPHVKTCRPSNKPRLDQRLPVLLGDANELLDDEVDRLRGGHAGLELGLVLRPAPDLDIDVVGQP